MPLHHRRWPRATAMYGFHPEFTQLRVPRRARQAKHTISSKARKTSHLGAQQTGPGVAIGIWFYSGMATSTSEVAAAADVDATLALLHRGTTSATRPCYCRPRCAAQSARTWPAMTWSMARHPGGARSPAVRGPRKLAARCARKPTGRRAQMPAHRIWSVAAMDSPDRKQGRPVCSSRHDGAEARARSWPRKVGRGAGKPGPREEDRRGAVVVAVKGTQPPAPSPTTNWSC